MEDSNTIFITGAASGIGRETALFFAREGWFLGLFDIDDSRLEDLVQEIGEDKCIYRKMDVTDSKSVQEAVAIFGEKCGKMDVLFNSAGILPMGFFDSLHVEDHLNTVNVNLIGTINSIYHSIELLKKSPSANIVNMSSASALLGVPELATYSATKSAIKGLTEALNIELANHNINVCDIMAPYVQTPMILNAASKATSVEKLGVTITPSQIAEKVFKAVQGNRVHWKVGVKMRLMCLLNWALPFIRSSVAKSLTSYSTRR